MFHASINCLLLFKHAAPVAVALALAKAGRSRAANMAMIAMTTSNSIKVNPRSDLILANFFIGLTHLSAEVYTV